MKAAQEKQKSYADKHRVHREFSVGDHVYLRVREKKSSLKEVVPSYHPDIVGHLMCLKE